MLAAQLGDPGRELGERADLRRPRGVEAVLDLELGALGPGDLQLGAGAARDAGQRKDQPVLPGANRQCWVPRVRRIPELHPGDAQARAAQVIEISGGLEARPVRHLDLCHRDGVGALEVEVEDPPPGRHPEIEGLVSAAVVAAGKGRQVVGDLRPDVPALVPEKGAGIELALPSHRQEQVDARASQRWWQLAAAPQRADPGEQLLEPHGVGRADLSIPERVAFEQRRLFDGERPHARDRAVRQSTFSSPSASPILSSRPCSLGTRFRVSTRVIESLRLRTVITIGRDTVAYDFRGESTWRLSFGKSRSDGKSARDQCTARMILSGCSLSALAAIASLKNALSAAARVGRWRRSAPFAIGINSSNFGSMLPS